MCCSCVFVVERSYRILLLLYMPHIDPTSIYWMWIRLWLTQPAWRPDIHKGTHFPFNPPLHPRFAHILILQIPAHLRHMLHLPVQKIFPTFVMPNTWDCLQVRNLPSTPASNLLITQQKNPATDKTKLLILQQPHFKRLSSGGDCLNISQAKARLLLQLHGYNVEIYIYSQENGVVHCQRAVSKSKLTSDCYWF